MSTPDIVAALTPIVDVFQSLGVPYCVAGSIASSAHGIARSTLDVDIVADLRLEHVKPLVSALARDYYIEHSAAEDAVRRRAMFNVINLATMLKVDVYLLTGRDFGQASFERRTPMALEPHEGARPYSMDTPEDTVLHKLEWYRAGGEVSERQWGDVVGVLAVQGAALDRTYLRSWATALGVDELLERALAAAGR